jgi:GT2 family glycosyltransferase
MTTFPPVQVLLATYNGERFLRQQIESILAQTYMPLRILARDDGSQDRTRAILEEYASAHPDRFELMPLDAATGGAKWNFVRLLQAATAEYVALSDQDDVWLPDKISREMEAMLVLEQKNGLEKPLLVFSDLRIVDDELRTKFESLREHQGIEPASISQLRRILSQNVVTGCTALLNRSLVKLATRMPAEAFMHDWWIALLACSFGEASALPEPTVLYRQHGANVLGAGAVRKVSGAPVWRQHGLRREQWEMTVVQAQGMLRVHANELVARQRALLKAYVRCETSSNRFVRALTWLTHGFFPNGLRAILARLWYLWDMDAAKRNLAD